MNKSQNWFIDVNATKPQNGIIKYGNLEVNQIRKLSHFRFDYDGKMNNL